MKLKNASIIIVTYCLSSLVQANPTSDPWPHEKFKAAFPIKAIVQVPMTLGPKSTENPACFASLELPAPDGYGWNSKGQGTTSSREAREKAAALIEAQFSKAISSCNEMSDGNFAKPAAANVIPTIYWSNDTWLDRPTNMRCNMPNCLQVNLR